MDINDTRILQILSESGSRIELWRNVIDESNSKELVEVGVWKGDFAEAILDHCGSIERYYMIDPWATLPDWNKPFNVDAIAFDDVYAEAIDKTKFASEKICILRGRTKEVINEIPDGSVDFAYIDGDHTLRGITIDLIQLLPKIKEGGLIAGDDFTPNPWQHDIRFEPTLVCPFSVYFAEAMDLPIIALPYDQFLIQKVSDASFSFTDVTGRYGDISLNKLPPEYKSKGNKQRLKTALSKLIPSKSRTLR